MRNEYELARRSGDLQKAAEIEHSLLPKAHEELQNLEQKWESMQENGTLLKNAVTQETIAEIKPLETQIPVRKMLQKRERKDSRHRARASPKRSRAR